MRAYLLVHDYPNVVYAELRTLEPESRVLAQSTLYYTTWRAVKEMEDYARPRPIGIYGRVTAYHQEPMQ